jgi:Ca2+-binding RTX toxin-like protein
MPDLYERLGGEILVNTATLNNQTQPTITRLANGGFVVSWADSSLLGGDTSISSIKAQIFDASGNKVGGEFLVNFNTLNAQSQPAIAGVASGGFVVCWADSSGQGGDADKTSVKAQIFDASGTKVGGEFRVNTTTANDQQDPSVTALASGGFVVSWADSTGDASAGGIKAQIFDASGNRVGNEFLVNTATFNFQDQPTITSLSSGGFVVSWSDLSGQGLDASGRGIKAQIFDASGNKVGAEFLVNTAALNNQHQPTITSLASGGFVVSWSDDSGQGGDASPAGIKAQIFDGSGNKVGGEFLVNTTTPQPQQEPAITALPSGGFVVSWFDNVNAEIKAQIFDASGNRVGSEFLVTTETTNFQQAPTITALASGAIVISWQDDSGVFLQGADPSGFGIKAQIFVISDGPTDIALSSASVSEIAIENLTVATLSATGSVNGAFSYSIVSDSTNGAFRLEGDRLVVADNARLDFETAPSATVVIRVTDTNGNSYDESFTLAVTDVANEARFAAGADFLVNTETQNDQSDPTIIALANGGFVVSWADNSGQGLDAVGTGIKAQIFDANGNKVGSEFLVNFNTLNAQSEPTITALPSGGFVVSWTDNSRQGGDASFLAVKAQIFNASGNKIGSEFLVNTATTSSQDQPTITSLSSGGFVVSWASLSGQGGDASGRAIKAQIFDASGTKVGGELLLNTATLADQLQPTITSLGSGGFVVSWRDESNQGDPDVGIKAQIFDASGNKVGIELLVNSATLSEQSQPTITSLASGGFVVSWSDFSGQGGDASQFGIKAQIFDASGNRVGGEFLVNTATLDTQEQPAITALPSGGFVVSWADSSRERAGVLVFDVKAQIFDASGNKVGNEFLVNTATLNSQTQPTLTVLASGAIVVSWTDASGQGGDASGFGIKVRIFSPTTNLIVGTPGNDNLIGTPGDDQIDGRAGDDVLDGRAGNDAMIGGTGNDIFHVDSIGDTVFEALAEGRDTLYASTSYVLAGGVHVEVLATGNDAGTAPINLTGNSLGQEISGNAGANTLSGGGGNDTLIGFGGNDIYLVDNREVVVIEAANNGRDLVYASVNYVLSAGAHVEALLARSMTSIAAINLTGNALSQEIWGSAGANMLDGGGGKDTLIGFGGNDIYLVDDREVVIIESAGAGRDLVYASVSYALTTGQEIEALLVRQMSSTAAINLTGNAFAQEIWGSAGANTFNGGGGRDTLIGFGGNDIYLIDNREVVVIEAANNGRDLVYASVSYALTTGQEIEVLLARFMSSTAAIDLTGNAFAQEIWGSAGANILNGGGGNDTLISFGGNDVFAFTTALGSGNVDVLFDFASGSDRIALDDAVFAGLSPGALAAGAFVVGSAAQDADDRIIYNSATGQLLFDADGNGAGAAVHFATVQVGTAIAGTDFIVI